MQNYYFLLRILNLRSHVTYMHSVVHVCVINIQLYICATYKHEYSFTFMLHTIVHVCCKQTNTNTVIHSCQIQLYMLLRFMRTKRESLCWNDSISIFSFNQSFFILFTLATTEITWSTVSYFARLDKCVNILIEKTLKEREI